MKNNNTIGIITDKKGNTQPSLYSFYKIIKTNNIIEIYQPDNPYLLHRTNSPKSVFKEKTKEQTILSRQYSVNRARQNIRRIILGNFTNQNNLSHVTLTFSQPLCDFDITSLKDCNRAFSKFIYRLRQFYPKLKYIKVAEFQDRGAVHYHMLSNIRYLPHVKIVNLWSYGFIKKKKLLDNMYKYLTKYLLKTIHDDRFIGLRSWSVGGSVIRPKTIYINSTNVINKIKNDVNNKHISTYRYNVYDGKVLVSEYIVGLKGGDNNGDNNDI